MMGRNPSSFGLYIHIPFCHARCGYCDFVTFTGKEDQIGEYVDALCQEIRLCSTLSSKQPILGTVFFGGGTPSVLEPAHIQKVFDAIGRHFQLEDSAEA